MSCLTLPFSNSTRQLILYCFSNARRGYVAFESQALDSGGSQVGGDQKEGYYLGRPSEDEGEKEEVDEAVEEGRRRGEGVEAAGGEGGRQRESHERRSAAVVAPDVAGASASPDSGGARRSANVWPPEQLLPGFRATACAYFAAAERLSERLRRLIAAGFGLPPDFFEPYFTPCNQTLFLLHYPPVASKPEDGRLAAGAHTDWCV